MTREDTDFTQEDRFEARLHDEVIHHREDRTIQFIAPCKGEYFDENEEIKEGPRVDMMVEIPLTQVNLYLSGQSAQSNEEFSEDFLEMDPEPSQDNLAEKRKNTFWIVFTLLCLFLLKSSWFIWTTPSKEELSLLRPSYSSSDQYVLEDTPLPLEWWEDSSRCEGKIAQQVTFQKSISSFLLETSEGNKCICGTLPIDLLEEQPMFVTLDGRKFYNCTPEEVFGKL